MELYTTKDISREINFLNQQLKSAKIQDRLSIYNHCENQLNDYLNRLNRFNKNESLKCENYISYLFTNKDPVEIYNLISSREFLTNLVNYSDFDLNSISKFVVDFYSFFDTSNFKGNSKVLFGVLLKNIAGDKISTKIKRLVDLKYITKLVWNNFNSYKDTYLMNKSFRNKQSTNVVSSFGSQLIYKKIEEQNKFLEGKKLYKGDFALTDDQGNELTLKKINENKSQNRLNEIYLIQKFFEQIQKDLGYTFLFSTLTCPAKFKPAPKNGHCSYEKGTMVKDGVNLLNECFSTFRKRKNDILSNSEKTPNSLKHLKLNYDCCGTWAKEPQSDGTPHTHFLFFCHPSDIDSYDFLLTYCVKSVFEKYDLVYSEEATLKNIRQDDNNTKNPSSYIFKYIYKCLGISKTEEQKEENTPALYHFALHKYRRYDFFGVDKILTVWREFKRMISFDKNSNSFNHFKEIAKNLDLKDRISFYKLYNYCKNNNFKDFKDLLKISNIQKLYKITQKEEKYKSIQLEYLKPHQDISFTKTLRGLKIFNLDIELRFFKII